MHEGTTQFREHKRSYTEIRTFVRYTFRRMWAALTVHKGSILRFRPFVH